MERPQSNRGDPWLALGVGVAAFVLLLATLDNPIVTWDEGFTISRESLMRGWFRRVLSPPPGVSRRQLFEEPAISTFWLFAREEPHGHPPFYAVIGNMGWLLSHRWLPPAEAHRFGPIVLFSFTTAAMFLFLARRSGRLAAVAAAGSWLLMPRVFAHAHLASYDAPLACLWFLSVVSFWKARECWPRSLARGIAWSVVFAAVLAMAAATKFTGWLIPLPLLMWSAARGFSELRMDGSRAFRKLLRLAVILVLPMTLGAFELHLLQKLSRVESGLETRADEDLQRRAARAASVFRAEQSSRTVSWILLANPLAWCCMYGIIAAMSRPPAGKAVFARVPAGANCELKSATSYEAAGKVQTVAPLPEIWAAAAALTPTLTVLLVPTWWPDPLRGVAVFLWSNLSRQKTTWIPTQFFGTLYEFSLPWYNTLAWAALTMPPAVLLLCALGAAATIRGAKRGRTGPVGTGRRAEGEQGNGGKDESLGVSTPTRGPSRLVTANSCSDGLGWLVLLNAATLLVIRALPGSPGHDGERQLLASFPFLACLAGFGAEALRERLAAITTLPIADWAARGVVAVSLGWSAMAIWHYRAAPLSYYTELVGGLPGAARLGLEPTYYWDALDETVLNWLNGNTRTGESVLFSNDFRGLQYLRAWGKLRVNQFPHESGRPQWYVLQNRPGLFAEKPWDRWLAKHGELAAFTRELDGVPLIWVFPFEAHENARRQTQRDEPGP